MVRNLSPRGAMRMARIAQRLSRTAGTSGNRRRPRGGIDRRAGRLIALAAIVVLLGLVALFTR